jgi:hypothetical protein
MSLTDTTLGHVGEWMFGKLTPKKYFSHLESHLETVTGSRPRAKELVARIKDRFGEIVEEDRDLVIDPASKGMLAMAASVLASYEVLLDEIGDAPRTIAFIQHIFVESVEHTSSLSTGLLFRAGKDSEKTITSFMGQLTGMYGRAMTFEFEEKVEDDGKVFEMRVTNCFFKNFFEQHGLTEVTTVLCAADSFWMDQIDPQLMGVRSNRTTLMSLGDDVDRFRIEQTTDPTAKNHDVLNERGPATRASDRRSIERSESS